MAEVVRSNYVPILPPLMGKEIKYSAGGGDNDRWRKVLICSGEQRRRGRKGKRTAGTRDELDDQDDNEDNDDDVRDEDGADAGRQRNWREGVSYEGSSNVA